nr:sm-like protein LSM1B [Tanacetum cinerariifolium]
MSWAGPEEIYLSTSLASYLDKKLLVLLRDGRKLLGILRSFDQFANAVLEDSSIVAFAIKQAKPPEGTMSAKLKLYILFCLGTLSNTRFSSRNLKSRDNTRHSELEKEELPPHMNRVSEAEIKRAQKVERDAMDLKGTMRKRMEFLDMD